MADRLVVLNGGRIEQVGTPMDVYSRPSTTFVAGFIGSPAMNLLPASFLRANGNADVLSGLPGKADLVGLRPEDIGLEATAPGGVELRARLDLLEPAGAETHLHVRLIDGRTRMTVRLSHVPSLAEGADLVLHAPVAALHPFEAESGRRIT